MTEDSPNLYGVSKYISQEITMQSQLEGAGSSQDRLLEKFEENSRYIRNITIIQKVFISFYFVFLSILPLIGSMQILTALSENTIPVGSLILTGSVIYSLYFGLQTMYLLVIGIPVIGVLMSGDIFRYLETLPLPREKLRKLGIITVFRSYNLPLITMVVAFPIMMFIVTQNLIVLLVCIGVAILNFFITISILTMVSERMGRFMKRHEEGGKKSAIIRILTMLGYIGMTFIVIFLIQSILGAVDEIFNFFSQIQNASVLNYVLSLVPYPFGLTHLVSLMIMPTEVPPFLWITTLIGSVLSVLVIYKVFSMALHSLSSVTSEETKTRLQKAPQVEKEQEISIHVEPIHPIQAFIKKDLFTASRDIRTLMIFILPLVMPLFTIFSLRTSISQASYSLLEDPIILWGIITLFGLFISFILISGLLDMDESGTTILASLPVRERDQAAGKLVIMFLVQTFGYILPTLILADLNGYIQFLGVLMGTLPLLWGISLILFELKARLFGKTPHKYVLIELNPERKVLKWALLGIAGMGLFFFGILSFGVVFILFEYIYAVLIFSGFGGGVLVLGYGVFNRMFPK